MLFLGIDLGTSSIKLVVMDETGAIKAMGDKFKKFVQEKKGGEEPPVSEEPVQEGGEQPVEEVKDQPFGSSGKLTTRHADNFKAKMKEELGSEYDEEMMTDDVVEEFLLSLSDEELQEIYNYKNK